jgi:hypothetical protein
MAAAHPNDDAGMNLFYYGFGLALSCAFTIAIGNAWMRDRRRRWDQRSIVTAAVIAIAIGAIFGWAIQQYLDYVRFTGTTRGY